MGLFSPLFTSPQLNISKYLEIMKLNHSFTAMLFENVGKFIVFRVHPCFLRPQSFSTIYYYGTLIHLLLMLLLHTHQGNQVSNFGASSLGKDAFCQDWWPETNSLHPYARKRKMVTISCSLMHARARTQSSTYVFAYICMCAHTGTRKK